MGMAVTMWLDFAFTDSNIIYKIVTGLIAITFGSSIAYSRLFLGVHSIDQVIYGASLGIWSAFTL